MKKVVEEIQALHDKEGEEIKYFIADASEPNHDFEAIAKGYQHLNITLFINNIGGSALESKTYVPHWLSTRCGCSHSNDLGSTSVQKMNPEE